VKYPFKNHFLHSWNCYYTGKHHSHFQEDLNKLEHVNSNSENVRTWFTTISVI